MPANSEKDKSVQMVDNIEKRCRNQKVYNFDKNCAAQESNPGRKNGRLAWYHYTSGANVLCSIKPNNVQALSIKHGWLISAMSCRRVGRIEWNQYDKHLINWRLFCICGLHIWRPSYVVSFRAYRCCALWTSGLQARTRENTVRFSAITIRNTNSRCEDARLNKSNCFPPAQCYIYTYYFSI